MYLFLLLFLFAPEPTRLPEVHGIVDQARAVPPEFTADVLLRLAESSLVADRTWKEMLIREAFTSAGLAQNAMPLSSNGSTDSLAGFAHTRSDFAALDQLSLRSRAIVDLASLKPIEARRLFQEIRLDLPVLKCSDYNWPTLGVYYHTLTILYPLGFAPDEKRRGLDFAYLEQQVRSMNSLLQVRPVSEMIRSVPVTQEQRSRLLSAFTSTLATIPVDDRSFRGGGVWLMPELVVYARNGYDAASVTSALRALFVRDLSGPRCSDGLSPQDQNWVNLFNRMVIGQKEAGGAEVQPISEEERKPLRDEGTYNPHEFWRSARSRQILAMEKWLNHGNRDLPGDKRFWTVEERSTPEWNTRYAELLRTIEDWKPDEEPSPLEYLHMKAMTYFVMAEQVPPGPERDVALRACEAFLTQSYSSVDNHAQWFRHVERLLRARDGKERAYFRRALKDSRNPVIALYARLGELLDSAASKGLSASN